MSQARDLLKATIKDTLDAELVYGLDQMSMAELAEAIVVSMERMLEEQEGFVVMPEGFVPDEEIPSVVFSDSADSKDDESPAARRDDPWPGSGPHDDLTI